MQKLLGIIKTRKSLLFVSAFAPMCLGAFMGVGSSQLQDFRKPVRAVSLDEIQLVNYTTTLNVTLETTATNHLLIRLKNLSFKDVNGYVVAMNDGRIKADMSSGDQTLPSGQTTELELPMSSSPMTLTILAAMFTDGTIEAEPVLKKELSAWRLALKKELARGLTELNAIIDSPNRDSAKTLDRLDSRLSQSLSPSPGSKTNLSDSDIGTQDAQDSFQGQLQSLRERQQRYGTLRQKQRLLNLKARFRTKNCQPVTQISTRDLLMEPPK